jgi:hypothetical protein
MYCIVFSVDLSEGRFVLIPITRPALSCAINQSAQTRAELAEETDFKKLEDAVTEAKVNRLPLLFPKFEVDAVV